MHDLMNDPRLTPAERHVLKLIKFGEHYGATHPQSWLDQRRARERQAAMFKRRRRQRLAFLVLALIGAAVMSTQLFQEQGSIAVLMLGGALMIPFASTFRIKL